MSADGTGPEASVVAESSVARSLPMWISVTLAVVFGLFYAYDVWEVVESVAQLLRIGLSFTPAGWIVMAVAFLAPFGCFAAAFLIGRRRGLLMGIALYFAGLCVSAALFLSLSVLLGRLGGVVV